MKKLVCIFLALSCTKVISNIDITNKGMNEDLVQAIVNNETYEALYLIEKGASINYISDDRKSILDIALNNKNLDIIKVLIEKLK